MASSALTVILLAASAALVLGCANPPGGCALEICASYSAFTGFDMEAPRNYSKESTWTGPLALLGFVNGVYNKRVNGGRHPFNRSAGATARGTPALNWEKFDYPTTAFAKAHAATTLPACCKACAETEDCVIYQFFAAGDKKRLRTSFDVSRTGRDTGATYQCFLLSGGSDKTDFPGVGLPFSGPRSEQANFPRRNLDSSFVGGRCNGKAIDDPHFTGAHGVNFEFNGELEKSFCLTTDQHVQLNALLKGYESENTYGASVTAGGRGLRSWIREVGLLWKDAQGQSHSLRLVARDGKSMARDGGFLAAAEVDGKPIQTPAEEGASVAEAGMTLTFVGPGSKGPYATESFRVVVPGAVDLSFSLRAAHKLLQTAGDALVHFNLMLNDIVTSEKVHGVLGQTYRNSDAQIAKAVKYSELARLLGGRIQADGKSGEGFLDGHVADYETTSVTVPDCKYSAF